jgi:spore germination protein KC
MKKFLKIIIISVLIIITSSGCWDNMDINDRAFTSAIALDKGKDGQIDVTLQILRPNIIKANQEGGTSESSIWTSTTQGETIFEAIRDQLKIIHRKPFYTHLRLIMIGEELAKEGIKDVLDFFLRDHEVRITPKIIVTKGLKAKDVINADSKLMNIPALHLEGILENNIAEAKTVEVNLIDVVHELTAAHGASVIATIIAPNKEKLENIQDFKIEGSAVLIKDKLIGYLNILQTRGYLFIKDEVDGGIIVTDNPKEKDKKVSIEIIRASGNMDVNIEGEDLILSVEVEIKGALAEQQGSADLANEEMLNELESAVEKEIEGNIKNVLEVAQKTYKSDFFGFGNKIYGKYPYYWDEIKGNWNEEFSKLPIEISIKAKLERTGTISQPMTIQ